MSELVSRLLAAIEQDEQEAMERRDARGVVAPVRARAGRALRLCRAHRKIIEVHRSYDTTDGSATGVARRCFVCASTRAYESGTAVQEPFPCPTIRALAEGFGITEEAN